VCDQYQTWLREERGLAVASIDAEQPIADVRTVGEWMARSLEGRRSPMLLLALFGAVALTLSAIGIYGVLAFGVAQRAREFGIRQALGADPRTILALVLGQGMRTTGIGIVLGLAGAVALTRYLQSLLFGVGAYDLSVYAGVTLLLLGVAFAACYVPARRAATTRPKTVSERREIGKNLTAVVEPPVEHQNRARCVSNGLRLAFSGYRLGRHARKTADQCGWSFAPDMDSVGGTMFQPRTHRGESCPIGVPTVQVPNARDRAHSKESASGRVSRRRLPPGHRRPGARPSRPTHARSAFRRAFHFE
jgi:hypothetical protein